jgi:hypothetical protein
MENGEIEYTETLRIWVSNQRKYEPERCRVYADSTSRILFNLAWPRQPPNQLEWIDSNGDRSEYADFGLDEYRLIEVFKVTARLSSRDELDFEVTSRCRRFDPTNVESANKLLTVTKSLGDKAPDDDRGESKGKESGRFIPKEGTGLILLEVLGKDGYTARIIIDFDISLSTQPAAVREGKVEPFRISYSVEKYGWWRFYWARRSSRR